MENTKKVNSFKNIFLNKEVFDTTKTTSNNDLLNYYASLVFYHPDIISVFSREGEVVAIDYNKINSLIGKTINNINELIDYISPETYRFLKRAFTHTLKGQLVKQKIEINDHKLQKLYLLITFIPIKKSDKIIGTYLAVTNLTEKFHLKKSLLLREKHLHNAQKIANIGSLEYSITEKKLYCSNYFYQIFGIDKEELTSIHSLFECVHPDDYELVNKSIQEALTYGKGASIQFRIYNKKNNSLRYLKALAEVHFEEDKPIKIIGVVKDLTYQTELEQQLIEQNELYKYMFDNLSSGIWMRESIKGKYIFASKGLEDILDIPVSKLYDDPNIWYELISPSYHKDVHNSMALIENGQSIQMIYRLVSGKGKRKWLLEQVVPRINEEGQVTNLFGLVIDITREMEFEEELNYLSSHDSLTGLPNKRALKEKLNQLCCNINDPFAVFYLDIDGIHLINDSLGYAIGDEALIEVARRFEAITPKGGYIARLGNNNFIMIVRNFKNTKELYRLAEWIIAEIQEPFTVQDYELQVSTNIGITLFPEEGQDKKTLLDNAHTAHIQAKKQAKKQGKQSIQLSSHLTDISSYKKFVLDRDLRKAVANDEFELYFQPQVEPFKGKICGAEALIRWNHKEWGLVSPGEFIPLAEENHMINSITDWVIEKVCTHIKEWREKGYNVYPISINIPPIRFIKKGLLKFVKDQLERHNIPGYLLVFEITERTLLKKENNVISTIKGLKQLGIKIAIDDFGMGYSTLDSLRDFKPNTIKMDRVFIKNISDNPIEKGIISSTIYLAKSLGMKIVAEGVEEYDQLNFLKQYECDIIQGYIYSKPVPEKKFIELMELGYLKATKRKKNDLLFERRNYFRHEFPFPIKGELTIIEMNGNQVHVGSTTILIENIGLGGLKMLSILKLPVLSTMKFKITFKINDELFDTISYIKWKDEEPHDLFSYGVQFEMNQAMEYRLAAMINKLSAYSKKSERLPGTDFVYELPHKYLQNKF